MSNNLFGNTLQLRFHLADKPVFMGTLEEVKPVEKVGEEGYISIGCCHEMPCDGDLFRLALPLHRCIFLDSPDGAGLIILAVKHFTSRCLPMDGDDPVQTKRLAVIIQGPVLDAWPDKRTVDEAEIMKLTARKHHGGLRLTRDGGFYNARPWYKTGKRSMEI